MMKVSKRIRRLLALGAMLWPLLGMSGAPATGGDTLEAATPAQAKTATKQAAPAKTTAKEGDISPVSIIFEHIKDAYWWHITTVGEHHVTVYLPVILYSEMTGWHVFSSSHLAEGATYEGFSIATEGSNEGKIVEQTTGGQSERPWDISLTKTALALVLNCIIMLAIFLPVASWYRRRPQHAVPGGYVGFWEMFVMSIEDEIVRKSIGKDYGKYSPYLLTAFFFIFVNNILGLIPIFPFGGNTTGNIAITFTLAICTMFIVNVFGNKHYWKDIFWPEVPWWLKVPIPLMPVVELFGVFSKPFALMIRLFANVMAGHSIALSLTCVIFITAKMGIGMNAGMSFFAILLSVFMGCLEVLIAYIQAYVFTMLSAVFIGLAHTEPARKGTEKEVATK
jgi:F-type H+-transporting ATPase subunit a